MRRRVRSLQRPRRHGQRGPFMHLSPHTPTLSYHVPFLSSRPLTRGVAAVHRNGASSGRDSGGEVEKQIWRRQRGMVLVQQAVEGYARLQIF
jgi:hypothetical protein